MVALVSVAWASGDWSATKSKVEEAKRKIEEVRKQAPVETRKIVSAICAADEAGRKSAAESASSSARSTMNDKFGELERTKRDALDLLEHVISDDKLKDNHSEARSLESDLKSRFDKVHDQVQTLRDSRHPVVEFMLKKGESARHDRMDRCDVKDFSMDYGHAQCLMARGDTCVVVELTADSSRAISNGKSTANRYKSQLESELKKTNSDVLKHLIDRKSDFAKCKHFEARVDCYKLCPEVDDDNRFRESSPNWRQDC